VGAIKELQGATSKNTNALLTATYCGERFCVKMERSDVHKNERSSMCPRAAICYALGHLTPLQNSCMPETRPLTPHCS
jgi:hypothetical protein